jgi:hypothetical protein
VTGADNPPYVRFVDPISGEDVALVVPAGGRVCPSPGEPKIGVEHPRCDNLADLAIELDAFYCPRCQWNGRISGAWAVDVIEAAP